MKTIPRLALVLALAGGAAQAADGAPPGCLIVFGQGRNAAADDAAANRLWDDVNLAFNAEVALRLQNAGETVTALLLRVTAGDVAGNAERLLGRAAAARCRGIVETTVFADFAAQTMVARLRHHPLLAEPDGTLRIGAPRYAVERHFQLTRGTLARMRPAELAQEMAAELLERGLR